MKWNWQYKGWPQFTYNKMALDALEAKFLHQSGIVLGTLKHINKGELSELTVDLISTEAIKTSEIEGEFLNRDSVQSSIRKNFGLDTKPRRSSPAEQGIAEMMVDLYKTFDEPFSHTKLFQWHKMLTSGRRDLTDIGCYRTHKEPMQIISGTDYAAKVHFEAPPSESMGNEMERFLNWINTSHDLPLLTRAGIAHLYFECIHPFEDGNGRIGRAVAEKTLSQAIGQPTLLALSQTIQNNHKAYYSNLERFNKSLEITGWLVYFAETILEAQSYSLRLIEFLIAKTKFYDRYRGQVNDRQDRAINRMFKEGLDGFKGGLSAENYISITEATRPTATRDLADLVAKGALRKTGERRYTRYWLNIDGNDRMTTRNS